MPAIIKVNNSLASGGLALVSYEVQQGASLTLSVRAQFVCAASAPINDLFLQGSTPPAILRDKADFIAILNVRKASFFPRLVDSTSNVHAGLRTISAVYETTTQPTLSAIVPISSEATDETTDGTSDGTSGGTRPPATSIDPNTGATIVQLPGTGGTSQGIVLGAGSPIISYSRSNALRSLSFSYDEDDETISVSFDYLAETTTASTKEGNLSGLDPGVPGVGRPFNVRGIGRRLSEKIRADYIETYRISYASQGIDGRLIEITRTGYYSVSE